MTLGNFNEGIMTLPDTADPFAKLTCQVVADNWLMVLTVW